MSTDNAGVSGFQYFWDKIIQFFSTFVLINSQVRHFFGCDLNISEHFVNDFFLFI